MPRRFPSPSSPTSPTSTMVLVVRTRDSASARASAASDARPTPLSEMPGASSRLPLRFTLHVRARGKHGVEMRRQQNHALGVGTGAFGDYVSGFVRADLESAGRRTIPSALRRGVLRRIRVRGFRSGGFAARWSRPRCCRSIAGRARRRDRRQAWRLHHRSRGLRAWPSIERYSR